MQMTSYYATSAEKKSSLVKCETMLGGHILHSLHGANNMKIKAYWKQRERATTVDGQMTSDPDELQQIKENPHGFCGLDGCFTSLLEKMS